MWIAGNGAAIARLGRRQATSEDEGTTGLTTVDPEMAIPGPMYAGSSGAGSDLNPDDTPSLLADTVETAGAT